MNNPFIHEFLHLQEIKEIGGWGVFTREDIQENQVVEISPVLLYPQELINVAIYMSMAEGIKPEELVLDQYAINWKPNDKHQLSAIMLGYLSMYNHSSNNNCTFFTDYETNVMGVIAMKPISKGSQLTVNYGQQWIDAKKDYINIIEF